MPKNLRKFTKTETLTFPDTKEKSDIQLEEDFTPVNSSTSQNLSSVLHIGAAAENIQCSSDSTAIPYVSLTADEEPVPETKDDCSHSTSFLPSTSIPSKSEDHHVEVSTSTPVNSEDKIEGSSIWITYEGRYSLQENDRLIIQQGGELTDEHINFSQNLIRTQFPLIGGLKSTLLQQKSMKGSCTANTIQIIHCQKRRHWIVASTIWCKPEDVNIYDSAN